MFHLLNMLWKVSIVKQMFRSRMFRGEYDVNGASGNKESMSYQDIEVTGYNYVVLRKERNSGYLVIVNDAEKRNI